MTDKPDEDAFEPNRVRISGETEANVVALSLRLESDAITIETRTSTVSGEEVTLPYDRIESVHVVREGTYTVVFETAQREYALTNLSADRTAVNELVDYTRARGELRTEHQSTGSTAESQADTNTQTTPEESGTEETGQAEQEETAKAETELDEWTWGETSGTD